MKISFDNNSLLRTDYSSNSGNSHWRTVWDSGTTEGGSSGSPLFDSNHRIIGQLHGGTLLVRRLMIGTGMVVLMYHGQMVYLNFLTQTLQVL